LFIIVFILLSLSLFPTFHFERKKWKSW